MDRDWQKDLHVLKEADDWEYDPTFNGEGNIVKDTTIIAENIGVSYASTIFNVFEALSYWINQAVAEKERSGDLQEELDDLNYKHEDLLERSLERKYKLAEEKERADIAYLAYKGLAEDHVSRGEYESLLDKHTAMTKAYRSEKERADKLREVIEEAMEEEWRLAGEQTPVYIILCQSLYPKEEEA